MAWLWLLISTALANTVVLPQIYGEDSTSKVGAEIVYAELIQALSDRRISVVDADDLQAKVGTLAPRCSTRQSCPEDIWPQVSGALAVKGTVVMQDDTIAASLTFHRPGRQEPVEHFSANFKSAIASRFAVDAALLIDDLLNMDGQGSVVGFVATGESGTVQEDALGPVPEEAQVEDKPRSAEQNSREQEEAKERRYMGLPRALYQEFKRSGQDRATFLAEKRFRGKRFFVELAPGLVFGDVQRRYTAVAQVFGTSANAYYERDLLLPGTAFSIVTNVGYAPSWWMDLSMQVGLEFPKKDFISGFEQYVNMADFQADASLPMADRNCPNLCDLTAFKPALAVTLVLEPRLRVYTTASGLVKPYAVVGWTTRIYDGYNTPDYVQVPYPNRSGLQSFGPTGGLGVAFDTHAHANAFVETTYTHLLGPGAYESNPGAVYFAPTRETGLGMVMAVRAGMGARL